MRWSWRGAFFGAVLAVFVWLIPRAKAPETMAPGDLRPASGRPGADGSGATGRAGDSLQWEIFAQRPELGDPPVEVWVHGNGWSVRCEIRPPGTGTRCVEMKEPVRL